MYDYKFDKTKLRSTSVYKKTLARLNSDLKKFDIDYVKTQIYCNGYTDKFRADTDGYYGNSRLEYSADEIAEAFVLAMTDFLNAKEQELNKEKEKEIADQKRWTDYKNNLQLRLQRRRAELCHMSTGLQQPK